MMKKMMKIVCECCTKIIATQEQLPGYQEIEYDLCNDCYNKILEEEELNGESEANK